MPLSASPDASHPASWASTPSSAEALMRLRAFSARFDFEGVEDFFVEVGLFIQAHFVSKWGNQFLAWCDQAGFQELEDIEPITVAAYIEQHPGSAATKKQHMAA